MLRRTILPCFVFLAALAAPGAFAVGVSGRLDPVETELMEQRDALTGNAERKKDLKQIEKGLKLLAKPKASESLPGEIKFAWKVAKVAEKKLSDPGGLLTSFTDAADGYERDLRSARTVLSVAAESGKKATKLQKALAKTDKALAAADAATSIWKRIKGLAKASKFTEGYEATGFAQAWVIETLAVAAPGEGIDLDGDGDKDNAFGAAQGTLEGLGGGIDLDQLLADATMTGPFSILQMWAIDSYDDDNLVFAGLLAGEDQDQDVGDNFSGVEPFDASASQDEAGFALARGATAFEAGGVYRVDFGGDAFELGGFTIGSDSLASVEGIASPTANDGMIGFALPLDQIFEFLEGQGIAVDALVRLGVSIFADIDLDGDGANDAISGAFRYTSVPCQLL